MHKHDLDLIAEFAGGSLRDDSRARALIQSCDICAAEFRSQQAVLTQLRNIEPAGMTELERAQLHRDLWTDLRSQAGSEPSRGAAPGWRGWAFGAAAIVFVAVALIGVMNNIGGGDAVTETFDEIGSGLDGGESLQDEDAGDGAAGAESAETTAAASESPRLLADEYSATPYLQIAQQVREKTGEDDNSDFAFSEAELDCLEQSGLADHELVDGFESVTELLVAVPAGTDLARAPVAFVEPEFCTVVHTEN
jgi:Flp pilus assembly pilin Flp